MPRSFLGTLEKSVVLSLIVTVLVSLLGVDMARAIDAKTSAGNVSPEQASNRRAEYQKYAEMHSADAVRGKAVFSNEGKAACVKCHSSDPDRKGVGPDLRSIGDKFGRSDLIVSILEPSRTIAVGYGTTIIVTNSGLQHHGVLQRVTNEAVELRDKDGKSIRVRNDEIDEQTNSNVSIMPEGLEAQMTQGEFADLIAYLTTLRQAPGSGQGRREVPDEISEASKGVNLVPFFADSIRFDHPVWFGQVPGSKNRYVVLEQAGRVWVIEKTPTEDKKQLVLDLTRVVRVGGATGLLGMAFHPEFAANGRYYLKYQIIESNRITTVVEERRWTDAAPTDPTDGSAKLLLKMIGSTQDHNGGCITFGPDGYLYIGMGDTGPQEDPEGHSQDLTTLLGKILRIDVNHEDANARLPYSIPEDNPFRETPNARAEIFAYGFREPWRFSFDPLTKDLWVGDVGQNRYEEVAIVRAGENHGWNVHEGFAEHSQRFRKQAERYVPPILAYPRRLGVSVTGGYVYRGGAGPEMRGRYIFGDFESRRIWALRQENNHLVDVFEIGRAPTRVVSFSELPDGELCLVGYDSGIIFQLDFRDIDLTPLRKRIVLETSEAAPVQWRYTFNAPSQNWSQATFDDSAWKLGPGGFGTTGTPGAIVRTDWNTHDIWLRRRFELRDVPAAASSIALRLHHDEDVVVYLNGVEAVRLNGWTSGYVEVPVNPRAIESLKSGENMIAIHCHQNGGGQYIDAGLVETIRPRQNEAK